MGQPTWPVQKWHAHAYPCKTLYSHFFIKQKRVDKSEITNNQPLRYAYEREDSPNPVKIQTSQQQMQYASQHQIEI